MSTALEVYENQLRDVTWRLDSGLTSNMTSWRDISEKYIAENGIAKVGNNDFSKSEGYGTLKIGSMA